MKWMGQKYLDHEPLARMWPLRFRPKDVNCTGYGSIAEDDRSCFVNLLPDCNACVCCSGLAMRICQSDALYVDVVKLAAITQDNLARAGKIEHAVAMKL